MGQEHIEVRVEKQLGDEAAPILLARQGEETPVQVVEAEEGGPAEQDAQERGPSS